MAMGDPSQRLQKFLFVTNAAIQLIAQAPPGANVQEMIKELYANAGYRDGARFFSEQQDPRLLKAMEALKQMKGLLEGKQMEFQANAHIEQLKLTSNERIKGAQLQVDQSRIGGDLQIRAAELTIEKERLALERFQLIIDSQTSEDDKQAKRIELATKIEEAQSRIEEARLELVRTRMELNGDVMRMGHELTMAAHERQMARDTLN
jgi:hypothetical protein